jgi:hypothetical protein
MGILLGGRLKHSLATKESCKSNWSLTPNEILNFLLWKNLKHNTKIEEVWYSKPYCLPLASTVNSIIDTSTWGFQSDLASNQQLALLEAEPLCKVQTWAP